MSARDEVLELFMKPRHLIASWLPGYAPSPAAWTYNTENLVADFVTLNHKIRLEEIDLVLEGGCHNPPTQPGSCCWTAGPR